MKRAILIAALSGSVGFLARSASADTTVKVASFNVHGPAFTAARVAPTAAAIRASGADVIGIQEGSNNVEAITAALGAGWTYREFANTATLSDVAVISRLPITQTLDSGVRIEVAPGQEMFVNNFHPSAYPYQPYDIRDGKITTEADAIAGANGARGAQIDRAAALAAPYVALGRASFVTGDFNEPSHLDWTQAAATAGLHPFKVAYPASTKLAGVGLTDSYRAIYPNEVARPGDTWTPEPGVNEVFDRLDFVYAGGTGVQTTATAIVGENVANADVVSPLFPSDHRLIVSTFTLPTAATARVRTGVNLISNGGAEGQLGGTGTANRLLTDWETAVSSNQATAQIRDAVAANGYQPVTANGGKVYFYGGANSTGAESHSITQTISLADLATGIDAARARFVLGGDFGGYLDQNDVATLTAAFLNDANVTLGTVSVGGVTNSDRANLTTLLARETNGSIPALTRSVVFTLTFSKVAAGTYNDGSADNLSFVVSIVPEPAAIMTLLPAAFLLTRRRGRA